MTDSERQVIYNNIEAAQSQGNSKRGEISSQKSLDKSGQDNVEECVLAGNALIKRENQDTIEDDEEDEESFRHLEGELIQVRLEQNSYGLGISLAGHKDRETMRTFICGMHPRGMASQSGKLRTGDLLVKVGEQVVWDRCHLNVTSIIKNMSSTDFIDITVIRNNSNMNNISVKPLTQYPLMLDDMVGLLDSNNALIVIILDL